MMKVDDDGRLTFGSFVTEQIIFDVKHQGYLLKKKLVL